VTSLLGLVLVFGTVWWWKDQMKKQDPMGGGTPEASSPLGNPNDNPSGGGAGNPLGAMGAQALDQMLQERFGYWIALMALAVAAGAGAIGMTGGAAAATTKPPEQPS